jgi:hypothetical protein
MSKYANFSNGALLGVFASLDQRRKSLLKFGKSLEDQRDIDLMKIKTHWDGVSKAERASPEGERYLVHWQARKAYWAQKIEENTNSIKPLMEEYHGVEALLKERGVNTKL